MLTAAPQDSSWNIYSVSFEADCMNGNEPGTASPVRPSGEREIDDFLTNSTHFTLTCKIYCIVKLRQRENRENIKLKHPLAKSLSMYRI